MPSDPTAAFAPSVVCPGGFQYNMRVMNTNENIQSRMNGLGHWVGNTPLLAIDFTFEGSQRVLYAKAENMNMTGSIKDRMAEEHAAALENSFLPRQFSNEDNADAHACTTGPEIWWQLRWRNLRPDALVAGIGTGGTIMGAGRFLREKNPSIRLHKKYLSTDLLREEPAKPGFLSPRIKLARFRAFKRVCQTCCDPETCLAEYREAVPCDDPDLAPCPRRTA